MINLQEPEIISMDIADLWATYLLMKQMNLIKKKYLKDEHLIKQGTKIKVDIRYFINKWYETIPTQNLIIVQNYGDKKLDEFYDEIDERNAILRKTIIENLDNDSATEGRN